jgi:5-methylcytosine-specific restriction endonuclease McrA
MWFNGYGIKRMSNLRLSKVKKKRKKVKGYKKLNLRIRKSKKYENWRTKIKKRDDFTCVYCKAKDQRLDVHHIKSFISILKENKIRTYKAAMECRQLWIISNGITLCVPCHKKTDSYLRKPKKS